MTKRKFYRTVVQVEILSEEPFGFADGESEQSNLMLDNISEAITSGPCVGAVKVLSPTHPIQTKTPIQY